MRKLSREQLFQLIKEQPPSFSNQPIKILEHERWMESEPFIKEINLSNNTSVEVSKITGAKRPEYSDMTWHDILQHAKRMATNLEMFDESPEYYLETEKEKNYMSYMQIDGGDYYVEQGIHRTCIAKYFFHYIQVQVLYGVKVYSFKIDHEAKNLFKILADFDPSIRTINRKLTSESGSGWWRKTFTTEFKFLSKGKILNKMEAHRLLKQSTGLWSRIKAYFYL